MKGYCVKCRKMSEMTSAVRVTLKNKRHAMKGKCKKCGTKLFRLVA